MMIPEKSWLGKKFTEWYRKEINLISIGAIWSLSGTVYFGYLNPSRFFLGWFAGYALLFAGMGILYPYKKSMEDYGKYGKY